MINRPSMVSGVMALAALVLTSVFVLAVWNQQQDGHAAIEDNLVLYDRFRSIEAFEPRLVDIENGKSIDAYAQLFMSGGTPAEVSANLTGLLNQISQSNGVQILRTSDLPPVDRQALRLAGIELELTGQTAAIYALVQRIEEAQPFLVIEKFSVRSTAAFEVGATEEPQIAVTMSIYAAIRQGQGGAQQAPAP